MRKGLILITFAWTVEIIGVSAGLVNSVYTTFPKELPQHAVEWLVAIPLALAELGRVPLASVLFRRHKVMQIVAILGMIVLGYLAVENWIFGFERIVELRMKPVNAAALIVTQAEAKEQELIRQRDSTTKGDSTRRDELRKSIDERNAQLKTEAEIHKNNLKEIREACKLIEQKCMLQRSRAEDQRYEAVVNRLNKELANLQQEVDNLVKTDRGSSDALNKQVSDAVIAVNKAKKDLEDETSQNQIYRLAHSFGWTLDRARMVFSTLSAIAVALAGSVAALVYYANERVPGVPTGTARAIRAIRAYFARRRRKIYRNVPVDRVVYRDGKEIVEKEVTRWVDRVVLIPRFGIKYPFHVNPATHDEHTVVPLKRAN
jgi:hypothetical protein